MFEAKLSEGGILKKIIESVKDLIKDVNLEVSPTGISMQAMDSSHVALVSMNLSMEGFDTYRSDKAMTLGINAEHLSKVLKLSVNDDSLALKAMEDTHKLNIEFVNKKLGKKTSFDLNLFTLDSEVFGIPEPNFTAKVVMSSAEFAKIIKELFALSETVIIEAEKDSITFSVDGEVGKGSVVLNNTDESSEGEQVQVQVTETVKLSFALRYLNMFNKAASMSNTVTILLTPGAPIVVEYKVEKLGFLKFFLAPKISEEGKDAKEAETKK